MKVAIKISIIYNRQTLEELRDIVHDLEAVITPRER